jgi:hypothetical protein
MQDAQLSGEPERSALSSTDGQVRFIIRLYVLNSYLRRGLVMSLYPLTERPLYLSRETII